MSRGRKKKKILYQNVGPGNDIEIKGKGENLSAQSHRGKRSKLIGEQDLKYRNLGRMKKDI